MSRKLAKPELAAVIKWTEDEWSAIASRLLQVHGLALLSSPALEEIKAKDVFNAQDVLPTARHRKLISISQSFAANRQRLHALLQKLKPVSGNDRAGLKQQGKQRGKQVMPNQGGSEQGREKEAAPVPLISTHGHGASPRSAARAGERHTSDVLASEQPVSEGNKTGTIPAASGQAGHSASAEIPGEGKHRYEPVQVVPAAEVPLSSSMPRAGPQTDTSDGANGGDVRIPDATSHRTLQRESGKSRNRASTCDTTGMHGASAATAQPTVNLVELARPFVAMVCQELATALVSALSRNAGGQDLTAALQTMLSGTHVPQPAVRNERKEPAPRQFKPESPQQGTMSIEDDKGHAGESDVQPLFDPKLPPSPNSHFKPMIGLIGASTRDFEDLQQFYPQLQLTVVSAEAVRTAPVLRDCQRMLGLREDLSADTDEFLRRAFGNRYLRVSGGAERIREQLDAWLDNPGSMNAAPGRPRKQFNGKGKGGTIGKKRHNRRPEFGRQ